MKINLIFKNSHRFLLIVSINLTVRQKKLELLSVKEEVLVVFGINIKGRSKFVVISKILWWLRWRNKFMQEKGGCLEN